MKIPGLKQLSGMQGKQNRLFLTILCYFLSLLIPIIIIGVSEYWYSVSIMKNEFNQRISTNLKSSANAVDSYIKTAQETSVSFLYDDTVQTLLMPKNAQSLEVKSELWRLPRILQRNENIVSHFADSMFVYIDNQDVYVSGGVNYFESFFSNIYKYEKYDASYWMSKMSSNKSVELLPVSQVIQEKVNVKQVIPIVMSNRIRNHSAVMVVNIAVDTIERTLKGGAVFGSTSFVVFDGNQELMYDAKGYLNDTLTAQNLKASFDENSTSNKLEVGGKRYLVAYVKSDLYGWNYYSFTPLDEFNHYTVGILQMTLLLCLVLMVMGIAFSFVFSLRIYNPIRNIRDIIAQKNVTVNGEHEVSAAADEFELIQQGINRMSDSHQLYKVKYDKQTHEYVEYSLLFLLKGHTINQEEILRETLKAGFGFTRSGFICCTVFFDFKAAFYDDIQDTERIFIINGIKKIVWNLLGSQIPCYVLDHRQNMFVCLINMDGPQETELLHPAFLRMLNIFEYDIRMYYDITIGIGTFYANVNDIGASYNEAMTAVSKRNKDQRFQIVDSNQMSIENSYRYSLHDEQKIVNYLKLGDVQAVRDVVAGIVESNEQRSISYEHTLQLYKEMYVTGVRFLAERGQNAAQLNMERELPYSGSAFEESFFGTKELEPTICEFFTRIIEMTKAQRGGSKSGNLVSLIEQYIHDHYTQDLGLEQIAEEMGVSVKYVSRVFKDKKDEYLTDYINQVRIEKAKEMLVQTELRVNEIAENVGIHSRTTFLRVFKKVEGITPNEYRTLHKKELH
ncbi:helix-turn-helix domain-containing protein [Paenibacillus sp. V4I5]|uniref:helix-turn-helix domain-containing protein n=1 Tax=Paenibacillus sp. V4I5 TaxID=3042306 RepID=UPI00278F20DC|nr:helix-turn-helix domain-containing protein [Paenibacillus sp. V4I5]MDQ0916934.1 two-component system response regulator YesN [Paenibacillus sp. V4I5]